MVANMSDEEIWRLNRGGHDPRKVFAAYAAAIAHKGQPTVILAKTVKGFGLGKAGEGQMVAHQQKKLDDEDLRVFRDRFTMPVADEDLAKLPFLKPPTRIPRKQYLQAQARALGGYLPVRAPRRRWHPAAVGLRRHARRHRRARDLHHHGVRAHAHRTAARTRPSARTSCRSFRMRRAPSAWKACSARSASIHRVGQLYTPQDSETLMSYREDKKGQMLEEGINEAGATCSWIAAGTAYSNHGINMVPFYIFYSMFGFQRVGDFIWAAG